MDGWIDTQIKEQSVYLGQPLELQVQVFRLPFHRTREQDRGESVEQWDDFATISKKYK
tara:strand:+ start:892 stop:1065 length:174 start_codon:yes stop_codon:yes gene_type:complete